MKWAIFAVAVLGAYPVGRWLRDRPALQLRTWTLIGFLPFLSALDMALVSYGTRPGDTNGIEVALIDWLALSLLFAHRGPARPLPYRFALTAYLVVAILSVAQAQWTLGAAGYVWKLCRMYLLFAVICREGHDPRVPAALLRGMIFGIVYEGAWAVWQHFGLGLHQVTGSFVHQNTLGLLLNLVVMVPIALILAGQPTGLTVLAPIAALPTCLFTVSRGTLLFFGAGSLLVYLLSALRAYDLRKARIGLIGLVLGLALVPLALSTLGSRSTQEQAESLQLRQRYERAAALMLAEHPLGVGPNHFTIMLVAGGYGERAGVTWSQQVAIVHNVYWLTAAEMGYPGVVALVILFLAPLGTALRYGLWPRRGRRGDVLLGLGAGLAVFYAHSFYEWAWRATAVSYVYWMAVAIVASLARPLRDVARRSTSTVPRALMVPGATHLVRT